MDYPYIDLHTHSDKSDGNLSRQALVALARDNGIRILAITDHNHTESLEKLRPAFPDMELLQAAEFSCSYVTGDGSRKELHVVGLGFDPDHPAILDVLRRNRFDRRPYIEAILARLAENNIFIGTYESLLARFPDTGHLGRKHIAGVMVEKGYVDSEDAAFDIYIGRFGQRKAYVTNQMEYVPVADVVRAIVAAGGYAVLCHPFYYMLEWDEIVALARQFRDLAGDRGAMEVYYSIYNGAQRQQLRELADEVGLMYSAASDYHNTTDTLGHQFSWKLCTELLTCLGVKLPTEN